MAGPARLTAASCMVLCLVGLVSANVPISNPTTLTSLQTVFGVTVSFMIDGQTIPANTSCVTGTYNAPCLTSLDADNPNTKAVITYQLLSNATLESTAHVILKVCYSAPSAKDRAWRKANNVIVLDKLCPFTVKTAQTLPPTTGTAMWEPSDLVPDAAYFVRAFAICPNATYGTSPCGVGNSKGFFQVNQIQSRPGNLKGAVIGMIFAGPIIFFAYLAIDSCLSKRRTKKGSKDAAQTQHIPHEADEKLTTLT